MGLESGMIFAGQGDCDDGITLYLHLFFFVAKNIRTTNIFLSQYK